MRVSREKELVEIFEIFSQDRCGAGLQNADIFLAQDRVQPRYVKRIILAEMTVEVREVQTEGKFVEVSNNITATGGEEVRVARCDQGQSGGAWIKKTLQQLVF